MWHSQASWRIREVNFPRPRTWFPDAFLMLGKAPEFQGLLLLPSLDNASTKRRYCALAQVRQLENKVDEFKNVLGDLSMRVEVLQFARTVQVLFFGRVVDVRTRSV